MTTSRLLAVLALFGLASLLLASDCDPEIPDEVQIYALTSAPPTRVARIVEPIEDSDPPPFIELSHGVILAVRCWDNCDYTCDTPVLTVSDPSVLAIRSVDRLGNSGAEMALVAVEPGRTNLTVQTECASKTYSVEIRSD